MMVIENKYEYGQIVFLKTDPEQQARMVTAFKVCPTGIIYFISFGTLETQHYDIELTDEKNVLVQ